MKTLELITRTDLSGKGYWINLYVNGKKEDCKYFQESRKEEAYACFDEAITNFEVLYKPEVLRTASFNDDVRTVYISAITGEALEAFPEDSTVSFMDIKTDATLEIVSRTVARLEKVDNSVLSELRKMGFAASR